MSIFSISHNSSRPISFADLRPLAKGLKKIEEIADMFRSNVRLSPLETVTFEELCSIKKSSVMHLSKIEISLEYLNNYPGHPLPAIALRIAKLKARLTDQQSRLSARIQALRFTAEFADIYKRWQTAQTVLNMNMHLIQNPATGNFIWGATEGALAVADKACTTVIGNIEIARQYLIQCKEACNPEDLLSQIIIGNQLALIEGKKVEVLKTKAALFHYKELQKHIQGRLAFLDESFSLKIIDAYDANQERSTFNLSAKKQDITLIRKEQQEYCELAKQAQTAMAKFGIRHSQDIEESGLEYFAEVTQELYAKQEIRLKHSIKILNQYCEYLTLINFTRDHLFPDLLAFLNAKSGQKDRLATVVDLLKTNKKILKISLFKFITFVCDLIMAEMHKNYRELAGIKKRESIDTIETTKDSCRNFVKNAHVLFQTFTQLKIANSSFFERYLTELKFLNKQVEEELAPCIFAYNHLHGLFQRQDVSAIINTLKKSQELGFSSNDLVGYCHSFMLKTVLQWKLDVKSDCERDGLTLQAQELPARIAKVSIIFQELAAEGLISKESADAYGKQYKADAESLARELTRLISMKQASEKEASLSEIV